MAEGKRSKCRRRAALRNTTAHSHSALMLLYSPPFSTAYCRSPCLHWGSKWLYRQCSNMTEKHMVIYICQRSLWFCIIWVQKVLVEKTKSFLPPPKVTYYWLTANHNLWNKSTVQYDKTGPAYLGTLTVSSISSLSVFCISIFSWFLN